MSEPSPGRAPRGEDGFALLLVTLILVVVAGFLLDSALRARVEYRQAANAGAETRARAAAVAGVEHAVASLGPLALARSTPGPAGSAPFALEALTLNSRLARVELAPGVVYGVRIHDVSARLHLNHADEAELRALFMGVGAGYSDADVAAQSILDWRDADELHRARGAEWDDWYRHQPLAFMPRNAPFRSLDELRQVRGMERLFPRVAPFLTVHGAGQVNLNTAPPEVLGTLGGIDGQMISLILNRRTGARPLRSFFELQQQLGALGRQRLQREMARLTVRAAFDSNLLEIEATGVVEGSPIRRTIRALVAHTGSTVQVVRSFEE